MKKGYIYDLSYWEHFLSRILRGGAKVLTPPPVSVPGEVFSSDSIYRDEEDDVEIREEDILEEIPIGEGDQAPEDLDDEEVK